MGRVILFGICASKKRPLKWREGGFYCKRGALQQKGGAADRRAVFEGKRRGEIFGKTVAWRQKTNAVCPSGKWSEAMNRISGMEKIPVI